MKFLVQRANSMPSYLLFSTCILFVRQKNFFLYLVVVDERSSSNDSDHSCSPPSKRYRKQCKEVQLKSLIQLSPTDCDESTSRSGVRRSDLGLLTFADSSPNIESNIHSRNHRMGKLNKLHGPIRVVFIKQRLDRAECVATLHFNSTNFHETLRVTVNKETIFIAILFRPIFSLFFCNHVRT